MRSIFARATASSAQVIAAFLVAFASSCLTDSHFNRSSARSHDKSVPWYFIRNFELREPGSYVSERERQRKFSKGVNTMNLQS